MTETSAPSSTQRPAASRHPLAYLFQVGTIKLRSAQVLQAIRNNLSAHFRLDAAALERLAEPVLLHLQATADAQPPALPAAQAAPLWQHLQAGGVDRLAELAALLADQPAEARARAWADLAFVGVLLSADPGPRWHCTEQTGLPAAASVRADPDDLLALLDRAGKTARADAAPPAAAAVTAAATDSPPGTPQDALPNASPDPSPDVPPDRPPNATPDTQPAAPSASGALPAAPTLTAAPAATTAATPAATPAERFHGAEGLAIATFRAFVAGAFSADRAQPCRVDAATLRHIDVAALRAIFQGTPLNPLVGLEGRAAVLSRLGQLLQTLPGAGGAQARPCDLLPPLAAAPEAAVLQAPALLSHLLRQAAVIWPAPLAQGLPAGDAWQHLWAGAAVAPEAGAGSTGPGTQDLGTTGWVPLHAMAQALVASLALPLAQAGRQLQGLEHLTACANHTTSGLLLATGVLVPRHPRLLSKALKLGDEAVLECRAATVAVFAELTERARNAQPAPGAAGTAPWTVAQVVQAAAVVATTTARTDAPALRIEGDGALF